MPTAADTAVPPAVPLDELFPRFRRRSGSDQEYLRSLDRVRLRAREFGQKYVRDRALDLDERTAVDATYFDWDLVRAGCSYGLLSLAIPTEVGGQGGLAVQSALMMEELCAACPGVANIFGAHGLGIVPLLVGSASHLQGPLAQMARAERDGEPMLAAFAITEPAAGTDIEDPDLMRVAQIGTHARRVRGGYTLSGTKHFISNGNVARWITVCMPTDPRRAADTCTCFLVDAANSDGLSIGHVDHKMGQRACPAAELVFDDVFVPDHRVVGREGDGMPIIVMVMAVSRPCVGAIATGIARGAYERLLSWCETDDRGRALLGRQQVQIALAEMEEEIHVARQAYMDAASELDSAIMGPILRHPVVRAASLVPSSVRLRAGVQRALASVWARRRAVALVRSALTERGMSRSLALSSLAKARGADAAVRVTGAALEIAGLDAGPLRAELEKLWRDAKLTQIYEGTNQLNRLEVYHGLCRAETTWALPRLEPAGARPGWAADQSRASVPSAVTGAGT